MVTPELLRALDEAWDIDAGFLGKLRGGVFDEGAGADYIALLRSLPPLGPTVSAELVKLIWFAPTFIEWQIDRATRDEVNAARLRNVAAQVHNAVVDLLGLP